MLLFLKFHLKKKIVKKLVLEIYKMIQNEFFFNYVSCSMDPAYTALRHNVPGSFIECYLSLVHEVSL